MRYTGIALAAVTSIIQDIEKLNVKNISIPYPHVQYLEIDDSGVSRENGTITIDDERVNDRLRYIILLWLFKNRLNSDADFNKVNSVYDDFGYPSDMVGFISYMPTKESGDKGRSNLIYNHWQSYLETYSYLLKT